MTEDISETKLIVKKIGKEEKKNTYEINKWKTDRNMGHLIQAYL